MNVMKYITILLLAVFLIPFVQNVNAQNIVDQLTGGLKSLTGGAEQSANNTSEQAGQSMNNTGEQVQQSASQAGQNMNNTASQAGQSMNNTASQAGQNASDATSGNNTSGGGIGDMLGNLMGQ